MQISAFVLQIPEIVRHCFCFLTNDKRQILLLRKVCKVWDGFAVELYNERFFLPTLRAGIKKKINSLEISFSLKPLLPYLYDKEGSSAIASLVNHPLGVRLLIRLWKKTKPREIDLSDMSKIASPEIISLLLENLSSLKGLHKLDLQGIAFSEKDIERLLPSLQNGTLAKTVAFTKNLLTKKEKESLKRAQPTEVILKCAECAYQLEDMFDFSCGYENAFWNGARMEYGSSQILFPVIRAPRSPARSPASASFSSLPFFLAGGIFSLFVLYVWKRIKNKTDFL